MTNILSINPIGHDTYASLMMSSMIVAACEQERYSGDNIPESVETTNEVYAGTDGVTDKNGKIHDPKSPKAKMIINMKRKPEPKE